MIFVALTWISVLALLFYGVIALLEQSLVRWHVSHRVSPALAGA